MKVKKQYVGNYAPDKIYYEKSLGYSRYIPLVGSTYNPSKNMTTAKYAGTIFYDEKEIMNNSKNQIADFRFAEIGFIFQQFHLLPTYGMNGEALNAKPLGKRMKGVLSIFFVLLIGIFLYTFIQFFLTVM